MSGQTQTAGKINGGRVARYFLLPEILPRARALGGSGFAYFAFLIACVYQAVRILPPAHPYTQPANIGKFGIRQAIAAAADHVTLSRKNIDQIIIFFAVIAAVLLLGMQFAGLIFLIFSGAAFAQTGTMAGGDFSGLFTTAAPQKDIALSILDYVFGIPDFFGSDALADGPTPFHLALQSLFQFYNLAILIVAVIIFLYFVVVVVAETALSGTPFGKRFNSIYAPLRLVFAIGLLVPLNYGLNASQYITLAAARAGSGLATNGWIIFNRELTNPVGAENSTLVAEPKAPDNVQTDQFFSVSYACKKAYELIGDKESDAIKPYVVNGNEALEYQSIDYKTAIEKFGGGNIDVVFGELGDTDDHKKFPGKVIPYCGILTIPLTTRNPAVVGDSSGSEAGPEHIQEGYFDMVKSQSESRRLLQDIGGRFAYALVPTDKNNPCYASTGRRGSGLGDDDSCKEGSYKPPSAVKSLVLDGTREWIEAIIKTSVNKTREQVNFKISPDVLARGWGGAGIWYNQIAELNGAMIDASYNFATIAKWPMLMEEVFDDKAAADGPTEPCTRFNPNLSKKKVEFAGASKDEYILSASAATYAWWYCDNTEQEKGATANIFWDAMNVIFGTNGLFALRETHPDDVHPLAAMTAVGKSLVESSIRNMAYSMGTAALGGLLGAIAPHWGAPVQAMSSFFVSVAMVGLTAGFILYYILPFLPFIYFFFAVGAWIKTIFEAMVGAPLWALAHLRIDGDGFSGRSAANGYFLIFEIFIRPILTLFGLLGGMAVFTAMAVVLYDLFDFVIFQVTGTELETGTGTGGSVYTGEYEEFRRSIVDEFFYTVLYAILLYMMGLASFKMIDLVPNNILRWMGAGVSSFADQAGDPKEGLVQYAALGGYRIGGEILGATNKLAGGVGSGLGGVMKMGSSETKPGGGGT
jgi:conjugal transfer/type IV secretion protein DotA/TraY